MTHQIIAFILGMLPILGFGAAFALHVVHEFQRIDRGHAPLGLGRESCACPEVL